MELFEPVKKRHRKGRAPLADRMRPKTVEEFVGQTHLMDEGRVLRLALDRGEIPSMILWGPPGSGKTTLAYLIAERMLAAFVPFSAVTAGIKEIKEVIKQAEWHEQREGRRTILFVDEIHRFNKAQQDAFLPHVEQGMITLIGATTENPSFEVIAPLLSRVKVFRLDPLAEADLDRIVQRALEDLEHGFGARQPRLSPEGRQHLLRHASGDARAALNTLELAAQIAPRHPDGTLDISLPTIEEAAQRRSLLYDKSGEEHYALISALHKSLRDSDPDAALYWLARMLTAGEDPLYIARRLIRVASEDIGNADPTALSVAVAAKEAYHFLGSPEGELALAQCACYLATAPKSNAVYRAYDKARTDVEQAPMAPVPLHLRNAPTPLMTTMGYGVGYRYAHDEPDALVDQEHLPPELKDRTYYEPTDRGYEAEIKRRLAAWRQRLTRQSPSQRTEPEKP
ncbi:MAG: replication-associated recombination protein A [Candidatus Methylomirabilales bacterium]